MCQEPTLAQFFVDKCLEHILLSACKGIHENIGRIARQKVNDLHYRLLWLTMCTPTDLSFILGTPRLILQNDIY